MKFRLSPWESKDTQTLIQKMREYPECVNGKIAADLLELILNMTDGIEIRDYTNEEFSNLFTLVENNKLRISFGTRTDIKCPFGTQTSASLGCQNNPHDIDVTHITVKSLQDAIRVMAHQFITTDTQGNNYESYIKPVGMKLIKICNDELNQLDEKDRYFPNLISNEEDLKHLVELIRS